MATKKPAPKKKAAPAKKTVSAPKVVAAKKPVNKAASPKKPAAAPVKKAAVKTAVAKKPATAPVKKVAAKPVSNTAAPKKAAPAPVKKSVVKPVANKVAPKKAAPAPVKKAVVKPVANKVAPKKVAPTPVKNAVEKPVSDTVAPKKVAPEAVKKADAKPVAKAEVKGVSKTQPKTEVKAAPKAPTKTEVKATSKPPAKPAKKIPTIAPEVRFAETSKAAVSPAELRKALRAKESRKDTKQVTMPKINTKSAVKYEPEFMKSVLDEKVEPVVLAGPTQRYSDVELSEFRELIQNKLNAAKQELAYLNGLITRKDSMSGEDSDTRYMTMEDGSLSMEREQLSQMASRQIDFIEKLEKAIMRIQNKTYGICRVTGKLIDKARLRAVPHATLSMEAKTGINKPGSSF